MIASVATTRTLVLQRSAACSHQRQQTQRKITVLCLMSYLRLTINDHAAGLQLLAIGR